MNIPEYADLAAMRADLMRDYAPRNTQERLLVYEVAASWHRLQQMRQREQLFFDLQTRFQARECGQPSETFKPEGSEVLVWLKDAHRALDQILRAVRDAGLAFDRAIRRLELVIGARGKAERQAEKDEQNRESVAMKLAILRQRAAASIRTGNLVELAPPRPKSRAARPATARAPDLGAS